MKKLVCLILCMLLMTGLSVAAQNMSIEQERRKTIIDDDVPIWGIADSWTYGVDTFLFQINESGQFIELALTVNNFVILVESETETSYQLGISGDIGGTFEYDDGAGTRFSGRLYFTRVTRGSMQIRKADIAAETQMIVIKSIALLTEHPLAIPIPIPIPLTITLDVEQTTPRPLVDFPLFDGKIGILPESHILANIKVESIVLKILHIFIPDIPEEIILDQELDVPMLQYNATAEEITVQAGTYNAYNIAFLEGLLGSIHYAPAAGNIVKADAELIIPDQLTLIFHGELKDTNYQP